MEPYEPLSIKDKGNSLKKRNGKKRRISIRRKLAAKMKAEAIANRSQAEKELAWREKQSRKNRLKKLKKREKKKSKKDLVVAESS